MKKKIISFLLIIVMLFTNVPQFTLKADAHTVVMTAAEFIDCLKIAYNRPNYYYNSYPYNLGYYDGSRISFDCWNLGKAIIWTKGSIVHNYTVGAYAKMDASCGLGDWGGYEIITAAPNCNGDFSNLIPGEWLYKENHIGYYIGDGQVIECTVGWGVNCITISQIDSAGRRSRNGVANGTWIYHGMVPWLDYSSYIDEEEPVISDVRYSDVSSTGYTISCTATDNLSVAKVAFPTWTVNNGQDDLPANWGNTQLGTKNGDTYTFRVNTSAHNNETGAYVTHIYAYDRAGNKTSLTLPSVEVRNDAENPVISDIRISELSSSGYTITCTATDDWGINRVAFPTWTVNNGQDDLPAKWDTTQLGKQKENTYTFRVNASAHNNETDNYCTHIYAYDCAGNYVTVPIGNNINLRNDTVEPVISDVVVSDITLEGYTVTCKATDDSGINSVAFPTWTVDNGQDDLPEMFMETQRGKKDGDTYSFYVKTSDHNNEQGQYATHIYVVDYAGNTVKYEVSVDVKEYPDKITLAPSATYTVEDEYLKAVKESTTVDSLLAEFENIGLKVLDKDGNVITGPAKVGTGATVNLYKDSTLVDRVTVVVAGDVDGNGLVDSTDYVRVKQSFLRTMELNEAEKMAADVEENNTIDSTDCLRIKSHFLKVYDLYE